MKRTIVYLLLLLLSAGIVGCSTDNADKTKNIVKAKSFAELDKVPAFACKDLNGNEVSSDIFADSRLTMLNIWATG